MAGTSIPLKWVLDYLLVVFEVPERGQEIVTQLAIGFPIIFALVILFVGVMDTLNLMMASIATPSGMERDSTNEHESDQEDSG